VLKLDPGGAERLVVDLARRLRPDFEPVVCCLDERGAWARELDDAGVRVHVLGRRPGFQPGLGRRLARLAAEENCGVVHCHQYSPFVYGCLAKWFSPQLRLVFTEHGRLAGAEVSSKRRLANRVLARTPGRFFAVCHELRQFLEAEGFPAGRLEVCYNGIEPGEVASPTSRADARRRLDVPEDAFVVGSVARLDPVKDLGTLLSAFRRLAADREDARLILVGDGPERERLEASAREGGLAGRVHFLGARDDVRRLLPALDVYVNSSTYEGVSLTIVEAMATGLPVVATRVGGTPEVLEHGVNGRLVPAGGAEALGAALQELAGSDDARRRLGAAARETVERRFRFDDMRDTYARAYAGER
jgi:glycosyltransferase involved in cell wall biosynthesis